ncbi:serine O-acetyltransferase [uncultured Sphingomonas sp.]|uniref:serine O-acetyltransferase n=1 Tax=uncultured Sphingomonas sp. TaxID=158754 RepID=UPI0035CC3441
MKFRELRALIREDLRANGGDPTRAGFRTLAVYRFGVWRMSVRSKLLRWPLSMLYRRGFVHCRNVYGIELPYTTNVGRRVVIEHQGGIVIHGNVTIGDECIIRQNCTLGLRRVDRPGDVPTLGARVNLGAGSVVLGAVTIGADAAIGANAVVLCDVPAGALAIGVPATVRLRG